MTLLLALLPSSIFSSWSRSSYGVFFLGLMASSLCFLVEVLLWSCPSAFLVSTLNFPNLDQRPAFFAVFAWRPTGSWWLGSSCSAGSELSIPVTIRAAPPNMKTPFIVLVCTLPVVLSLYYFSSLRTLDVGVLHLRTGFTHRLFPKT